jgi:hypothetical protein
MKTLKVVLPFTLLCLLLLTCKERDPVNPLDPDNPNTKGQAYTIQVTATGIGKVKVHWRKVNQPEVKGYRIYGSVEGESPSQLADATDTLYFDTQLQAARAYSYFYRLIWEDGRELHQSPTAGIVTFNAPTGLTITNVTRNRVEMQWNGLSWLDNYARCRIYRQSGGAFSLYDSTSSTQYVDTRVDTGITYHYKLMAVATDGSQSNYSGEAYATPGNSAPVIDSLKASQPFTGWGEQVTITCYAHDNDGDPISYSWEALDGGTISGFGKTITFTVPQDTVLHHRVEVTVTDGYSPANSAVTTINSDLGLVAYYPFNGNANDESVNNNNGTVYGATLTSDRFGNADRAYSFDGIDDHIEVRHRSSLQPPNQLSVCAWVYIKAFYTGSYGISVILKKGGPWAGIGRYEIFYADRYFQFDIQYANGTDIRLSTPDTLIQLNTWYFLVLTYNGQSQRGYINGKLRVSQNVSLQLGNNADNMSIGWNSGNSSFPYPVNGIIDDIRIYDRALSESEIQMLYHEGGWAGN